MRPYLLLTALCLALFLPGLTSLPPIDRDESRFAQASKQMIESGDYIRIQFQSESRAKKPAGIYWLEAASAQLTGATGEIWAYRLPSALGGLAAVLLLFAWTRRQFGEQVGLIAAGLLAASFLLVSEAHQAKTDAVQLACIVAAQGVLARLYLNREQRLPLLSALLFWLAQGAGILIKGPIVPMISLTTVLALLAVDRSAAWLRGLRPLAGIAIVAAMVGPWAWAINHATAGQFIGQAVKNDLFAKLTGGQESHGAAPGSYAALLMLTMWPASLFVIPALPQAVARRSQPIYRFLLAWIIPNWLIFEIIPTKLPHYILPVYPALTLLAALWLTDKDRGVWRGWRQAFGLVWGLVGSVLAALPLLAAPLLKLPVDWSLAPLGAAMLVLAWAPLIALNRDLPVRAVCWALLAAIVGYGGIFLQVLPSLQPLLLSPRIVALLPKDAEVVAAGYHEPSLVFLQGTSITFNDGGGAAAFLLAHPDGWAVVENEAGQAFFDGLAKSGRTAEAVGKVDGFNYSRGRPAHIILWRLVPN